MVNVPMTWIDRRELRLAGTNNGYLQGSEGVFPKPEMGCSRWIMSSRFFSIKQ